MQEYSRKYGVQTTLHFTLIEIDGVNFRVDAADGGADLAIMKDEGAEVTCVNDFADEGTGYSIVVTATEMEAKEILIYAVDQSGTKVWLDDTLKIETYGNAAAMHAMDFDDAVRGGMTALPNAAANAAGGLPVSSAGGLDLDNDVNDQLEINHLDHIFKTAYDPASKPGAADALLNELVENDGGVSRYTVNALEQARGTNSAALATGLATHDGKLDTAQSDLDKLTGTDGATLATAQGNYAPAKVGDAMTLAADAIKAVSYDESTAFPLKADDAAATQIARVGADGDTLETLSDQIDAVPLLTEMTAEHNILEAEHAVLSGQHEALATEAKQNTAQTDLDTLTDARGEPAQGALPVSAVTQLKIDYIYKLILRNKRTSEDDSEEFYNDAEDTVDHKRSLSDDGSVFTKGEVGTGP